MYFPQQSPGIAHKLANHHDQSNPWARSTHPHPYGPPPSSPGFPLSFNGAPMQHHMPTLQHHHQNSMSHYSSPPANGSVNAMHGHPMSIAQASPGSTSSQIITPHWQQQLLKCDMIRASRSPHHRARASAMASRTVTKSAITITNPNKPPPSEHNGTKDSDDSATLVNGSSAAPSPKGTPANANHPSSMVGPIAEAPRPTAAKPPENTWSSLDMGGVQIKNIPSTSGLFSFTFLINLYLNHNALTNIPPEISKLRHLELLDLSGNNLMSIPPELGMLTQLKELYLFDNHLTTIPYGLGTLHQLQTLGIEGNPMDANYKAIVQKEGTPALISFLRDSGPVTQGPPPREWRNLVSQAERELFQSDPACEQFSVLCYNILCEKYATERLYGYTPSWALAWDYRKELILTEIVNYDADFICLQEVDTAQFEDYFTKKLADSDYEGIFWPKSRYKTMSDADRRLVDGCATFYKKSKYQLVEKHLIEFNQVAMQRSDFKKTDDMFNRVLIRDHIAVICSFENRETGTRFVVANAHLEWNPQFRDVKLVQVALMMDEVEKIANHFAKYPPRMPVTSPTKSTLSSPPSPYEAEPTPRPAPLYSDGTKIPLIVCGDYNSVPDSGLYEFLSNGTLPPDHPDFLSHSYGKYTSEGLRHRFGLKSAFAGIGELSMTNFTPTFKGAIDYIWYSTPNLAVNAVLGDVDKSYLEKAVGFPNAHFPSDHVAILGEFRVKPPREAPARPPLPVFPSSH